MIPPYVQSKTDLIIFKLNHKPTLVNKKVFSPIELGKRVLESFMDYSNSVGYDT
jgi:hypothetical protein